MALLRNSSKLRNIETDESFFLTTQFPEDHSGCFDLLYNGTPLFNPEPNQVHHEESEEKIDHRPKDWYDKQCDYQNFMYSLVLNISRLNKDQEEGE